MTAEKWKIVYRIDGIMLLAMQEHLLYIEVLE